MFQLVGTMRQSMVDPLLVMHKKLLKKTQSLTSSPNFSGSTNQPKSSCCHVRLFASYILEKQSSGLCNRDFYPPNYHGSRDDLDLTPDSAEVENRKPLPTAPLVTVSYEDGRTITLHPNVLEISYYVIQTEQHVT